MDIEHILQLLRFHGATLHLEQQNLRLKGLSSKLKESGLAEILRQHKEEIVSYLTHRNLSSLPDDREPPAPSFDSFADDLSPASFPLANITQDDLDRLAASILGGAHNIQDIYGLSPLQEAMLFHHLAADGEDPYLLWNLRRFASRGGLDQYITAYQHVIDRHDILRTAVVWKEMTSPVQVVLRHATVSVQDCDFDPAEGDVAAQLTDNFGTQRERIDLGRAPLARLFVAEDKANARWLLLELYHHMAFDHVTIEMMDQEINAVLRGDLDQLPKPSGFRKYILRLNKEDTLGRDREFFAERIGNISSPTHPFGLERLPRADMRIREAVHYLGEADSRRLRGHARRNSVSASAILHLAWSLVLARASHQSDRVVFGTVLSGRGDGNWDGESDIFGPLINLLPLMVELGDRSVISAVKQTHQSLAALVGHAHASLVMAQKCSQVPPATPLFTAIMNYRGQSIAAGPDEPSRAPRPFAHLDSGERNSYPLTLTVDEGDDDFRLSAQVEEAVEPDHICRMLVQSIDAIVTALETAPHSPVAGLEVLDHPQRDLLIKAWNATDQPSSRHGCVHRLFEEQALRTPERTAIVDGDHRLSYAQLNEKADRVAACLQDRGVAPGATICVCLPRSLDSVATLIALFKLGAAYMPLDAAQPYSRQKTMLEDARPSFVITTATGGLALPKIDGVPLIVIDDAYSALPHRDAPFKSADTAPNALAYVIYTSGSTGAPKGVMGAHGAVASRLLSERDRVRAGDVFAHKTNLGFIDSLWEIFLPLISGARLEVISAETVLEPELFVAALSRAGATHLVVVPALLGAVLDAAEAASGALDKLRYCACSGDALSAALAERWCLALPGAEITNIYGATEFWDATAHPYAGGGRDLLVPIGKPLPNVRVYVLDDEGRLAPIGVEGTLHVAGSGVALGYVGDEKRSGGGFMSPPAWLAEELIFKTGDRVRWRADGILEYRGRTDRQVKIRGFRIELDEVEIALTAHPDIHQAAVLATAETPGQTSAAAQDISADKRLVAYVVSETRGLDLQAVRQDLKLRFPDYMVPSVLVQLDALPLTSSGKVDRKALPEPEGGPEALAYMAPRTPVEAALVSIWADVLKLERVGVHDNFFELGGHSLLVMRILSKLKQQLGVTIPLRVLFAGPTPGQLAEHIQLTRLVSELGQTPEAMEDGDVGVL